MLNSICGSLDKIRAFFGSHDALLIREAVKPALENGSSFGYQLVLFVKKFDSGGGHSGFSLYLNDLVALNLEILQ